jgi:tripeptidyl-peptidase I
MFDIPADYCIHHNSVAGFPHEEHNKFGCYPGTNGKVYNPDFSSSCPYITSVGATQLYPGQTVNDPESAMQVNLTAWHEKIGEPPLGKPYGFFATSVSVARNISEVPR